MTSIVPILQAGIVHHLITSEGGTTPSLITVSLQPRISNSSSSSRINVLHPLTLCRRKNGLRRERCRHRIHHARCGTMRVQGTVIGWVITFVCRWVVHSLFARSTRCRFCRPQPAQCARLFVGMCDEHCTLMCISMWGDCVWRRSVKELRAAAAGAASWNMVVVSAIFSLLWARKAIPGR